MATATLIQIPPELVPVLAQGQDIRVLPEQTEEPKLTSVASALPNYVRVGSFPSALPEKVQFAALRHPLLALRAPIPLRVERTGAGISVVWDAGEEFGLGETFSAAVDDFSHTVAELYFRLNSHSETFGNDLIELREKLGTYIEQRKR
jgi:hypothetical protein